MKMFILGAVVALFVSSVGLSGTFEFVEQGVVKAKEYTPVIENTLENIKSYTINSTKP
jgi:hypothetical protein